MVATSRRKNTREFYLESHAHQRHSPIIVQPQRNSPRNSFTFMRYACALRYSSPFPGALLALHQCTSCAMPVPFSPHRWHYSSPFPGALTRTGPALSAVLDKRSPSVHSGACGAPFFRRHLRCRPCFSRPALTSGVN